MKSALIALGFFVMWQARAAPARAGAAAAEDHERNTRVERLAVVLVDPVDSAELRALITEWLEPTELEISVSGRHALRVDEVLAADEDARRARVWLTLVETGRARLYFADPNAERFLVRDVPLERGLDEVGREQLVQVLLSAAQAFVERRESTPRSVVARALSPPDSPQSRGAAPAPEPAPKTSHGLVWSVGARYDFALAGPETIVHGLGATLESALDLRPLRVGALAEFGYQFPHATETADLRVVVSALAFRLRLLLAHVQSGEHAWTLELGVGLDRVVIDPEVRGGSDVVPREPGTELRASLGGSVAHFWYAGDVRIGIGLGADALLVRPYYDIAVDRGIEREIAPWQVTPGAFLGLAWP